MTLGLQAHSEHSRTLTVIMQLLQHVSMPDRDGESVQEVIDEPPINKTLGDDFQAFRKWTCSLG